jgi:spore maturation protein CgeB
MKLVIFGLTISSSWGNGHATLWRGLSRALARRNHRVIFFERDVSYYASHRDLYELPGMKLELYSDWSLAELKAKHHLSDADVAMVTSYCPDGIAASERVASSRSLRVFYDLDTPVTLAAIDQGKPVSYIGPRGLKDFDLVLSYTGGRTLDDLKHRLGARRVAPLYGSVDPEVHRPLAAVERYRADLSYIGTYAEDRQRMLKALFLEPARHLPERKFLIAGAKYPIDFPWTNNSFFVQHVPPPDHPALYSSSRITLNITRSAMAGVGHCPSGRLFEAAACGTPILSDVWEGLEQFFEPGREVMVARNTDDTLSALGRSDKELGSLSQRARARVLAQHSADCRAREFEDLLGSAASPTSAPVRSSLLGRDS